MKNKIADFLNTLGFFLIEEFSKKNILQKYTNSYSHKIQKYLFRLKTLRTKICGFEKSALKKLTTIILFVITIVKNLKLFFINYKQLLTQTISEEL